MRVSNTTVTASLIATMSAIGCGGKSKDVTKPNVVAKEDLAYLPVNSDVVATLDAAGIRSSAMFGKYGPKMIASIKADLDKVQQKCGLDPVTTLTSIAVGVRPGANQAPTGVVVVHGFTEAQIDKCFAALTPEEKTKNKIRKDGATWIMSEEEAGVAIGFVGPDTALLVMDAPTITAADFAKVALGEGSVLSSPAFAGAWTATPKGHMRVLVNMASTWLDGQRDAIRGSKLIGLGMTLTADLAGSATVTFNSADDAKAMQDMVSPFLGMAESQVGLKAKMSLVADKITLDASMSAAAIDKLMQQM
jgi:hypothetical protein